MFSLTVGFLPEAMKGRCLRFLMDGVGWMATSFFAPGMLGYVIIMVWWERCGCSASLLWAPFLLGPHAPLAAPYYVCPRLVRCFGSVCFMCSMCEYSLCMRTQQRTNVQTAASCRFLCYTTRCCCHRVVCTIRMLQWVMRLKTYLYNSSIW